MTAKRSFCSKTERYIKYQKNLPYNSPEKYLYISYVSIRVRTVSVGQREGSFRKKSGHISGTPLL